MARISWILCVFREAMTNCVMVPPWYPATSKMLNASSGIGQASNPVESQPLHVKGLAIGHTGAGGRVGRHGGPGDKIRGVLDHVAKSGVGGVIELNLATGDQRRRKR